MFLKAAAVTEQRREGEGWGRGVWYDSAFIPVVDVSANCVRLNERDTAAAVEVHYFFSSLFLFF